MRTTVVLLSVTTIAAAIVFALRPGPGAIGPAGAPPVAAGEQIPTQAPAAAVAAIEARLAEADYCAQRDGAAYQAENAAQRYATRFAADGVHVSMPGRWDLGWNMSGFGRGEQLEPVSPAAATACGSVVEYHREGMIEWYVNEETGLEQGVTIADRPTGDPEQPVRVRFALDTELTGDPLNERAIVFRDADGRGQVLYHKLLAYDAAGAVHPATMELDADGVVLAVDDRDAAYPLTIDPTVDNLVAGSISIFVDSITRCDDGSLEAQFGYYHENFEWHENGLVFIPNGPDNNYSGDVGDQTPVEYLEKGVYATPAGLRVNYSDSEVTWTIRYFNSMVGEWEQQTAVAPARSRVKPVLENGGYSFRDPDDPDMVISEWGYLNRLSFPTTIAHGKYNRFYRTNGVEGADDRPELFTPGRHYAVFQTRWDTTILSRLVWVLDRSTATAGADRVTDPDGVAALLPWDAATGPRVMRAALAAGERPAD
ncbi:MAG: hypothetical protein ACOCZK_06795 [Planctomycetota bacterium]